MPTSMTDDRYSEDYYNKLIEKFDELKDDTHAILLELDDSFVYLHAKVNEIIAVASGGYLGYSADSKEMRQVTKQALETLFDQFQAIVNMVDAIDKP